MGEAFGIISRFYYGKSANELSEEEKQTVSALATLAAGFLLVRQDNQQEANHAGALAGGFQRVDSGERGVVFSGQQSGYCGHHTFTAAAEADDLKEHLPVIAVCQHHK